MKLPERSGFPEREPERVKGAAIRYNNENFDHPHNHDGALRKLMEKHPEWDPLKEQARGWLTTRDRIVTDDEAREIEAHYEQRKGEQSAMRTHPESTLFKEGNE